MLVLVSFVFLAFVLPRLRALFKYGVRGDFFSENDERNTINGFNPIINYIYIHYK